MSILAYTGLPGSGKSYNVVENQILPALKEGRIVVTNIPLHEERLRELTTNGEVREFPIDRVKQEPELIDDYCPPGCVLVIDELWKLFPAGDKVNRVPEPYKRLLAEHRHMVDEGGRSTQIVFVTQDLAQIGAFARQLVEQTIMHTKMGHLGTAGTFRYRIFLGAQTGQNPPKSAEIRMGLGRYDERIYKLYQSHTMSKAGKDGAKETAVDTRGNVWKRPGILLAALACIVAIWWAGSTLADIFTGDEEAVPARVSGATARPASALAPARGLPSEPSKRYRVSSVVESTNADHAYAVLTDDAGDVIYVPTRDCRRERWQWRCEYKNQWWTLSSPYRPFTHDSPSLSVFGSIAKPE